MVASQVSKIVQERFKKLSGDPCLLMKEKLIRANKLKGMSPPRPMSLKRAHRKMADADVISSVAPLSSKIAEGGSAEDKFIHEIPKAKL